MRALVQRSGILQGGQEHLPRCRIRKHDKKASSGNIPSWSASNTSK